MPKQQTREEHEIAAAAAKAAAAKANAAIYLPTIPSEILKPARRLLEQYSGIAPDDVEAHIYAIV